MDEVQLIGYAVLTIITLASFIGVVMKFIQPINELRVVIQKLNDNIESMKKDDETRDKRLNEHGDRIDKLNGRVGKLETKMQIYHKD